jgi:hypothetical protein
MTEDGPGSPDAGTEIEHDPATPVQPAHRVLNEPVRVALALFVALVGVAVGLITITDPNRGVGWLWAGIIAGIAAAAAAMYLLWADTTMRRWAIAILAVSVAGILICATGLVGVRVTHDPDGDEVPGLTRGKFTFPKNGGAVKACSYFRGTSSVPVGDTLMLAQHDVSGGDWYVDTVFQFDQANSLDTWEGALYFNEGAIGKTIEVLLFVVDVQTAGQARESIEPEDAKALVERSTKLDRIVVKRVEGGSPEDCPGPA